MVRSAVCILLLMVFSALFVVAQDPQVAIDPFGNTMKARTFNTSFFEPYSSNFKSSNSGKYSIHPEGGRIPYNAPVGAEMELVEKRTAFSRTFLNANGDQLHQYGYQPLHFKNANGEWISIDERLHPVADQAGVFSAPFQVSPTLIDLNNGFTEIQQGQSKIRFNQIELFHISSSGQRSSLGKANWTNFSAGSDGVYITNAWPGIDIQMLFSAGSVKTNYLVTSSAAYTDGYLVFSDRPDHSDGNVVSDAIINDLFHDDIRLSASNGAEFIYSRAFGYDQEMKALSVMRFNYKVTPEGRIELFVPVSWLKDSTLSFPLVIDPLVTSSATMAQASIGGSYHQNTGLFTIPCSYAMNVPTPANCTITDIQWSFNYIAQNGAALCYGAVDIVVNGCRSPANPSFYWFCNNCMFAGTCTGSNISIFADVSTCVPAAQCLSYNLPCTLNFYARAVPITGCSNFYIGANSNWTMTIEGHTLEQTSPPSSSSGTTICLGGGTLLTGTGTYGVSPYTYVWNPGGQTTQSVWVTPTTTTTYTCTITDACGNTATNTITITVNTNNTLPIPNFYMYMTPASGTPCPVTVSFCTYETAGNNYGGGPENWQWFFPGGTVTSGGATSGSANGPQYGGAGADATCNANDGAGSGSLFTVQYTVAGSYNASVMITKSGDCAVKNWAYNLCALVPIELIYFNAYYHKGVVELSWETLSETENDFFTVERSTDGINFVKLGVTDGAGTSSQTHSYQWVDDSPPSGIIYYRLRQTDFDKKESVSDVRSVLVKETAPEDLTLVPNPASGYVSVYFHSPSEAVYKLRMLDVTSREIYHSSFDAMEGGNNAIITLDDIPPGHYLVEVSYKNKAWRKILIIR